MTVEVAIVGNGVAGTACATRLARHGIRPLLIGRGLPVDRPPLSKAALADGTPRLLADHQRLAERGIDRLDGVVTAADRSSREARASRSKPSGSSSRRASPIAHRPFPASRTRSSTRIRRPLIAWRRFSPAGRSTCSSSAPG